MRKDIIINSTPHEVRVAILEDGEPVELLIERADARRIVGNLYKGRVTRVLPGMQAAFRTPSAGSIRSTISFSQQALSRMPKGSSSAAMPFRSATLAAVGGSSKRIPRRAARRSPRICSGLA